MKNLAITIAGAVSLGAYEAGVAYEILQALAEHNGKHKDDAENQIQIDVLTGASAGGMTATILAQKLLFQPSRLAVPADNDLYRPWVVDVDLSTLLAMQKDEPSDLSALSSNLIEAISQRYLIAPLSATAHFPTEPPHPAAARRIKLGLALSNLNGVDYGLKLASGGTMPYTRFQDQMMREADRSKTAGPFWDEIRNAAVSCGAFPVAFRVKELLRYVREFRDPAPLNPITKDISFAYTDGGLFQNEPIGLAKRLVDDIDDHVNDQRFYLFVAPGMRTSAANSNAASPGAGYYNYLHTAESLANAIFNQARYRDLENVEQINQQIAILDAQVSGLKDLFVSGKVSAEQTQPASEPLLRALFPNNGNAANPEVEAAQSRLQRQYREEYGQILSAKGQAQANAFIDAVLLLETVAGLGPKDRMAVYAITDDSDKLAGSAFYAFAGFFDVAYRQHDYDRGRQSVRDFIAWLRTQPGGPDQLGPIDYAFENRPPIKIDETYANVQMKDIAIDKRKQLRDRLHDRMDRLLQELNFGWLSREAVEMAYLNGKLNKLFEL